MDVIELEGGGARLNQTQANKGVPKILQIRVLVQDIFHLLNVPCSTMIG